MQPLFQKIKKYPCRAARRLSCKKGLSIMEILIAVAIVSFVFIPAVQVMYSIQPKSILEIISGSGTSYSTSFAGSSDFYERGDLRVSYMKGGIRRPSSAAHQRFSKQSCIDFNPWPAAATSSTLSAALTPLLFTYTKRELGISTTTTLTGTAIVGQKLYVSANSSSTTEPDVFVYNIGQIDNNSPSLVNAKSGIAAKPMLTLIQSKNTGPGISSIQSRGMHLFSANTGVKSQVDLLDNDLITQVPYVIPGSNSTTSPLTKVILPAGSMLLVGTEKSVLPEIVFFDADSGRVLHGIETGYGINDMIISDGMLFVAGPRDPEIEVFDVSSNSSTNGNAGATTFGQKIGEYDLPGGSGNAKTLSMFGNILHVGRTKGGNEFVLLEMIKNSAADKDLAAKFPVTFKEIWNAKIGWSVDAMLNFEKYVILFAADEYREFQMYGMDGSGAYSASAGAGTGTSHTLNLKSSLDLPARVSSSICFKNTIWATLRDPAAGVSSSTPALALIVFTGN
jgi:hypothetical protein